MGLEIIVHEDVESCQLVGYTGHGVVLRGGARLVSPFPLRLHENCPLLIPTPDSGSIRPRRPPPPTPRIRPAGGSHRVGDVTREAAMLMRTLPSKPILLLPGLLLAFAVGAAPRADASPARPATHSIMAASAAAEAAFHDGMRAYYEGRLSEAE